MTPVKRIKIQLIIFSVLLLAFFSISLILFQKNYYQFKEDIFKKSKQNVEVIDVVETLETQLYGYQNAFYLFLTSGDFKWKTYMEENKSDVLEVFPKLELYNQEYFRKWITIKDFSSPEPRENLKQMIEQFQKGPNSDSDFQRLFYLIRYNVDCYFQQVQKRIESSDLTTQLTAPVINTVDEEAYLQLMFSAISHIRSAYNHAFWDVARFENDRYNRNTFLYYYGLLTASIFLFSFAVAIALQVFQYFGMQRTREEDLVIMGTRDLVTGLFNRRSLEVLIAQEMERAKRRGYGLTVFAFKMEPYDKIKTDIGQVALDRLLFQIAVTLRASCRSYDGIYRYDKDIFIVTLLETKPKLIDQIVLRFKKKLYKKEFVVSGNQTKISPIIKFGCSLYPLEATDYPSLINLALSRMTLDFQTYQTLTLPVKKEESEFVSAPVDEESTQPIESQAVVVEEVVPEDAQVISAESVESSGVVVNAEIIVSADQTPDEALAVEEPQPDTQTVSLEDSGSEEIVKEELIVEEQTPEPSPTPEPLIVEETITSEEMASEESEEVEVAEELPEIVAALNQEEDLESKLRTSFGGEVTSISSADINSLTFAKNLPEIEVVRSDDQEDVIMIDFDREKTDLAEQFRRKQRKRRKS